MNSYNIPCLVAPHKAICLLAADLSPLWVCPPAYRLDTSMCHGMYNNRICM